MAIDPSDFFQVREVAPVPGMPDWAAVRVADGWRLAYYRPEAGEPLRPLETTGRGFPNAEALIAWWETGGHDD